MILQAALKSRNLMQRLGVRLASLMALALLPLGIVAYLQTSSLEREAQGRTEEALMGESLLAAANEMRVFSHAQGLVAAFAQIIPDVYDDTRACSNLLRDSIFDAPEITLLSFVPKNGLMTCASNLRQFDYSQNPLFQKIVTYREPAFTNVRNGPVTGTSAMGVIRPVFDRGGDYLGYVAAWLPHDRLRLLEFATNEQSEHEVEFWTFNSKGEVLTASMGVDLVGASLPARLKLNSFAGKDSQVFTTKSTSGLERTYAVLPIIKNQLYIMSSWKEDLGDAASPFGLKSTWFPILLWLAGLGVSIWAAEILVVRHVRSLNKSIAYFARGKRRQTDLDLVGAPLELQEMAQAYSTMTDDIMRNEASLEDEIHQKEVLLREVHHRVKNNLQLIASIMNMQMRQARSLEAKGLLKGLQERIMSLATIHRGLYQTTGLSDIYSQELLSDITRQTVNMATGPGRQVTLTIDFDDIRLTPDQAVPLSLLLTEALTNAIKYARAPDGTTPDLFISLKHASEGQAVLEVVNSVTDAPVILEEGVLNTSTGLGAQLLVAFAQQIGGTLTQEQKDNTYRLQVVFAIADLAKGENRVAGREDEPSIP